ncbi:ADP-ribosylglycohydrolase family protein [Sulfurisoma sediminicola]|uniref:ADP-ribosylglycohydrolase n=1 Tax=Sulfurisoma sediminicola TaxID=1381557 RepID=A0A497XDT6_9PROT|nr:ADP-ribosylglycohydrolase family protein [Sulfurisoma sediminicola]RLJ65172.1 ADP-ribosylglycohydrolase [Sulfurisoma sediminicola]
MAIAPERAAVGCLLGTAVGDALGLACEGLSARRQRRMFPSLDGYHLLFGKGLCSDDTEHACMVAQAIVASGGDDIAFVRDFAWRLRWWLLGLPAGIGLATLRGIVKLWLFVPERFRGVHSAGNAPAMRSAILGVCCAGDEPRLLRLVRASTRLTHTDPKAECGALAIALAARCSMQGRPFEAFVADLERLLAEHDAAGRELVGLALRVRDSVASGEPTEEFVRRIGGAGGVSGYVYQSVPAVLHAWHSSSPDFARALKAIIRCGGDTDTTAAMLGGIIGAGTGKAGIPAKWLDDLAEWPRTVRWMEQLALRAEQAAGSSAAGGNIGLPLAGLLLRNAGFIVLVLAHGFRRALPPY